MDQSSSNMLLAALPAADLAALRPHLKTVDWPQETVLFEVGDRINQVYFPHTGVVSLVVPLTTGETIETAMIGRESVVGGSAGLNGEISLSKAIVQIAGTASVVDASRLRALADASAACAPCCSGMNRSSSRRRINRPRATRPTLSKPGCRAGCCAAAICKGSDDLQLTQEFLGQMLGVRRTSVSVVANTLQQAGFIRYRRGHIRILDLEGLQETACECYATVRSHAKRLAGASVIVSPAAAIRAFAI